MGPRIFWSSFLTFAVLNIVENILHYSIGRYDDANAHGSMRFNLVMPSKHDWIKIVFVMIVFAMLQGFITCFLIGCKGVL